MRLTQPSLIVTFYLQTPETVTVTDSDLIRDSFNFQEQLLNGLNPSSNKVSFKLHKDAAIIPKILSYQVDAKAVLKDGNTVLFTGYLSDNYTWKVNDSGESQLEIIIEDVGTKLLGKAFLTSNSPSLYNLKGSIYSGQNSILTQICVRAGITIAASQPTITTEICANIDKNLTCKDLLGTMLLEAGYTYYFNNEGKLCLYKIDCSSVTGIPIIDKNSLYAVGKNAITLTKRINQYKQINVSYDEYETRSNVLIYKDISGQDDSHPDCNITLKPNQYYPINLLDVATVAAMQALTASDTEVGAFVRVTATNKTYTVVTKGTAGADVQGTTFDFVLTPVSDVSFVDATDIDEGKEIIYIENVVGTVVTTGSVTHTIAKHGAKDLSVVLHNTGNSNATITKLQAKATITDIKANCILIAGEGSGTASENVYSTTTKYIHTKAYVQRYANMIADYYKYCNYSYQFYATTDYPVGTIVNVVDNLFSGLTVNILITARKYTDKSNIITYSGVAISPFDLSADINSEQTLTPVTPASRGPAGESITTTFEYALTSSSSVTPTTWYSTRPDGWQSGYCYWYREKFTDESGNVTYSSAVIDVAYNSMMESLVVFEITANPSTYKRNLRTSNNQTITINVKREYIPGTLTLTAKTEDDVTIPITTVTANEKYTITVNDVNDFDKIIITGTLGTLDPRVVTLEVVDETEYNKNFGSVTALPTDITINGDYFFVEETFTDGITFTQGFPYVKSNGSWTQLSATSPEDAQRLLGVMSTVLSDEQTPASLSAIYGWFQNLAAQSAVINSLFSEAITILNPGYIKSSNFNEVDGFVSQGFKLNSSGLGQFGEGTQLGNVDIRITDSVAGTPVQLLTTSKYAQGASYSVTAKTRWLTDEVLSNSTHWNYCQSPYTDNPTVSYNGTNYYPLKGDFMFKPGESSDYVLTFDKACTVTINFNGLVGGIGRYGSYDLLIDGQRYHWIIDPNSTSSATKLTFTKSVSAGGSITINTGAYPYKPQNTGNETDGVRLLGSVTIGVKVNNVTAKAVICNKRVKGYSNTSTQTLPTAGTYNFKIFPAETYILNTLSFTHTYGGGGSVTSASYINYTNLSNFATIDDGNYTLTSSTIAGQTVTAFTKNGTGLYFFTSGGNSLEYNTSVDTSEFATSGWYNTSGSITLVGSQSSLITYNINASDSNADIGAVQPYNNIHANNFYGTHRGNVNGTSSGAYSGNYKVWGAVFN